MKLSWKGVTPGRSRLRMVMPSRAGRGLLGAGLALALVAAGAVGVGAATWAGFGPGFGSPVGPWYSPPPRPPSAGRSRR